MILNVPWEFLSKLLKSRKTDTKYNKTPTFPMNVNFITFIICL